MELNRWLDKRTGAFQWGHAIAYAAALEGKCAGPDFFGNHRILSGQYDDKVLKVKTGITEIIQCDLKKENLTDPVVLPLADCLITAWLLEIISKDKDEFKSNLKKFLKLLKPGGSVILIGIINATYYTAGRERLYVLTYDENFLKNVLIGEGFIIDHCDILNRTSVSDLIDYKAISFISAHKVILTDGQSPGSGTPVSLGIPMPESHTSASQL
ncbi:indolethylamine N-methyltransferase-like [Pseudophryne corroboree]|uniref:indolethylamine N-methyltransferase-like n=1 Tax=Pseudophryne corroboree TaxID=495146 RepID=UPI003081CF03